MYTKERLNNSGKVCPNAIQCNDSVERINYWFGKIALMYGSDYVYSTTGGVNANKNTCLNIRIKADWGASYGSIYTDCNNNSWLRHTYNEHIISPGASENVASYSCSKDGSGSISCAYTYNALVVRPSLYLKSDVVIDSGEGTSESPYKLSM